MKWVYIESNTIREIIPDSATVPSIAHWYGEAFAAQCREAPDEVAQHWVYDPETDTFAEPPPPPEPEPPIWEHSESNAAAALNLASIVFVQMAQTEQLDDVTVTEHASLFPEWDANWTGKAGTILRDEGKLYRSIHDVGQGQNTKPSLTPSMWTQIGDPADEWPVWIQPLGGHDAYNEGDKVSHAGRRWISSRSGNVWEPGVYGWTESA